MHFGHVCRGVLFGEREEWRIAEEQMEQKEDADQIRCTNQQEQEDNTDVGAECARGCTRRKAGASSRSERVSRKTRQRGDQGEGGGWAEKIQRRGVSEGQREGEAVEDEPTKADCAV